MKIFKIKIKVEIFKNLATLVVFLLKIVYNFFFSITDFLHEFHFHVHYEEVY